MQLAIAALGKVFAGLGLGGSVVGPGIAGANTVLSTGAATAGGLQGLTTAISALATIGGGLAGAAESRDLADQADLQDGQEQVQSAQRQAQMKRSLLEVLGNNDVTFAAAGIDLSSGIAQSARTEANKRAVQELSIDRQDTDFRRALHRMRAQGYRRRAGAQIGGALLGAVGQVGDYGIQRFERGM